MTAEERNKKLEEALKDEAFAKALAEVKTEEDLKKVFDDRGIEVSPEDIKELMAEAAKEEKGELDEEALEEVSGGMILIQPRWFVPILRVLLRRRW